MSAQRVGIAGAESQNRDFGHAFDATTFDFGLTSKQEAAINLLPQPGDGNFASQKMTSLQGMIDPLRKQIPHMPGADLQPSWLEQRRQNQPPSSGSNLGQAVMGNDPFSRLVPSR